MLSGQELSIDVVKCLFHCKLNSLREGTARLRQVAKDPALSGQLCRQYFFMCGENYHSNERSVLYPFHDFHDSTRTEKQVKDHNANIAIAFHYGQRLMSRRGF